MENNVERGSKSPPGMAVPVKQPPVRVVRAAPAALTSAKPFKRVQVVYYLTRHGQLDHPHYMEVTLLAHHQLRLRDVLDRLSALRGKAMPSMYSWSCKRSYKKGYVWNDLTENDIIHPTDRAEYVLKGSEIIFTCPEFPRPIDHHVVNSRQLIIQDRPGLSHCSKRSLLAPIAHNNSEVVTSSRAPYNGRYEEQDCVGEGEYDVEDKTCYTSTTNTPQSRPSHGVTADYLYSAGPKPGSEPNTKASSEPHSPSITTSSNHKPEPGDTSTRYLLEDNVVSVGPSPRRRNSVLMQLISCGNMTKSVVEDRDLLRATRTEVTVVDRDVHYLSDDVADDKTMIRDMSENPRLGNLQAEDKMFFSGSVVEQAETELMPEVLKRSNSYNEHRVSQETEEAVTKGGFQEKNRDKAAAKSKCIPCIISSSKTAAKRK